jgi:hypothetical protein
MVPVQLFLMALQLQGVQKARIVFLVPLQPLVAVVLVQDPMLRVEEQTQIYRVVLAVVQLILPAWANMAPEYLVKETTAVKMFSIIHLIPEQEAVVLVQ